jgi:hypothetical protein
LDITHQLLVCADDVNQWHYIMISFTIN